jgi:hypothetical protein
MSECWGTASDADEEEIRDALSGELGRLTGNDTFTVAEFAAAAATIFEVSRDEHGTPTVVRWEYAYSGGTLAVGTPDRWSGAMADAELFYRQVAPKFIAATPHQLVSGLRDLLPGARHQVRVFTSLGR